MADAEGSSGDAAGGSLDDPEGTLNVTVWTYIGMGSRNCAIAMGTSGRQFTMDITGMSYDAFVEALDKKLALDDLVRTAQGEASVWPRCRSRIVGRSTPPERMADAAKRTDLSRFIDTGAQYEDWLQEVAISKYSVGSRERKEYIAYCRKDAARKDRLREIAKAVGVAVGGTVIDLKKRILDVLGAPDVADSSDDSSSGSSSSSSDDDDDDEDEEEDEEEEEEERGRTAKTGSKRKTKESKKKKSKKAKGSEEADEEKDVWFIDCLVHVKEKDGGGKKGKTRAGARNPTKTADTQVNGDDSDSEGVEQLLLYIYHPAVKGKKCTVSGSKKPFATAFVDMEERGLLNRVLRAVNLAYSAKRMGHDPRGKMYMKASKSAKTVEEVPGKSSLFYEECKFMTKKKNDFATPNKPGMAVEKYKMLHIMGTAERPNAGDDEEEAEEGDDASYSGERRSPVGVVSGKAAAQADRMARSRSLEWLSARSKELANMNNMHFQLYLAFLTGNVITSKQRDRIIGSDAWPDDDDDMPNWTSPQNRALHGPPPVDGAHQVDQFGKAPKYQAPRGGDGGNGDDNLASALHAVALGMSGGGGAGGAGGSQRGTILEQAGASDRRRLVVQSIQILREHLKPWDFLGDGFRQGHMPDSGDSSTGDRSFNFSGDKLNISGVASAMLLDLNDTHHDALGPFTATLHDWCCSSLPDPFSPPSITNQPDGAELFKQFEKYGYVLYMESNGGDWGSRTLALWNAWYDRGGEAPSSDGPQYHGYMTFDRHREESGDSGGGRSSADPLYVFVERNRWFAA